MTSVQNALCLCPSSRLSLATLVLSTWVDVRRFVLTEEVAELDDLTRYDALVVMDHFATAKIVSRVRGHLPVFVLAWNGLFEIDRLERELAGLGVTYVGTDESIPAGDTRGIESYRPLVSGDCLFAEWLDLYASKERFDAIGSAAYRARWLRTRWLGRRAVNVVVAAGGAARARRGVRAVVASAFVRERLVWAGNCWLDLPDLGLTPPEQARLEAGIAHAQSRPRVEARLEAVLALVEEWQALAHAASRKDRHDYYIINTLLRWAVIGYLGETIRDATWFFGKDNLGLGLDHELYAHNLVPSDRLAFLELGGKTSETALYPRALHLLAREFYVIPISLASRVEVIELLTMLRTRIESDRHGFFAELEQRRTSLYASLSPRCTLREAQARVWTDFAAYSQLFATGRPSAARSSGDSK